MCDNVDIAELFKLFDKYGFKYRCTNPYTSIYVYFGKETVCHVETSYLIDSPEKDSYANTNGGIAIVLLLRSYTLNITKCICFHNFINRVGIKSAVEFSYIRKDDYITDPIQLEDCVKELAELMRKYAIEQEKTKIANDIKMAKGDGILTIDVRNTAHAKFTNHYISPIGEYLSLSDDENLSGDRYAKHQDNNQ